MHPAPYPPWLLLAYWYVTGPLPLRCVGVDALLENGRWLEHHDPARRDRHFLAGLRIAADPFALLAHHERSERGKLHRLAPLQTIRDLLQHHFDQRGGL